MPLFAHRMDGSGYWLPTIRRRGEIFILSDSVFGDTADKGMEKSKLRAFCRILIAQFGGACKAYI